MIKKDYIERSLSYKEYVKLIDSLLAEGRTTGSNQSEAMVNFTRINRQRMQRLEKTIELTEAARSAAWNVRQKMVWLIISEAWCGDAAQNIPAIEKIAMASGGTIATRYVLRDENSELMDRFLTNGARSIPKLIALNAETLEVLGTWGARPDAAQQLFQSLKEQGMEKPLVLEQLQRWYNADRTATLQNEFVRLIGDWGRESARVSTASTGS